MHNKQSIESTALEFIQRALAKDQYAISTLLQAQVGCTEALADDPHFVVNPIGPTASPLGMLNGLLNALGCDPMTFRFEPKVHEIAHGKVPQVCEVFYQGRTIAKPVIHTVLECVEGEDPTVHVSYDEDAARRHFESVVSEYLQNDLGSGDSQIVANAERKVAESVQRGRFIAGNYRAILTKRPVI